MENIIKGLAAYKDTHAALVTKESAHKEAMRKESEKAKLALARIVEEEKLSLDESYQIHVVDNKETLYVQISKDGIPIKETTIYNQEYQKAKQLARKEASTTFPCPETQVRPRY